MIEFYRLNGEYVKSEELTLKNVAHVNGMKIKCYLESGETIIGYCKSGEILTSENIEFRCSFDPEDGFGDTKVVHWTEVEKIEALLYSGPRWGGKIDFSFPISSDRKKCAIEETCKGIVIPDFLKK